MGTCCESNGNRLEKRLSTQNNPPSLYNYNQQKTTTNYNTKSSSISNRNTNQSTRQSTRQTMSYYKPNNTSISHIKSEGSYGISSKRINPETKIDNKNFTEYDLKKIQNIYYNLMMLKATEKKTIGQGGQAIVRKYYSPKFKRYVVEKVINISNSTKATLGEEGLMNFFNLLKEAILLSGFNHPNVVKIYDFKDDPPTIIMEYCAKGSLRNLLNQRIYLPPLYKFYLIFSICNGLKYVHSKGIVHGDLKCDNILLSDEKKYYIGRYYYPIPKLADFGLGQFHPNDVVAGTPGFIAPEILKGSGLNFKTDIFALGMVMFEILSGLRPLPSDYKLAMSFLQKKMIPCTKEILRKAWELRCEEMLPGIKNPIYDAFYTIMIGCIDDDPKKRPSISDIFPVITLLYGLLYETTKKVMKEEESSDITDDSI